MARFGAVLLALSNIVGTIMGSVGTWYSMAAYYGWGSTGAPPSGGAVSMTAFLLPGLMLLVGVLLLGTSWWFIYRQFWRSKLIEQKDPSMLVSTPAAAAGFQYFPNRESLTRVHGELASRLKPVANADAIFVVGADFYHAGQSTHVIRRLILPNPEDDAFGYYLKSVGQEATKDLVKEITNLAKSKGAKVRWCKHFICHTMVLADVDKSSGWVHIESVFPHSLPKQRPGYTISKLQSADAVAQAKRIFDDLWDNSAEQ